MANWLQKILPPAASQGDRANLPAQRSDSRMTPYGAGGDPQGPRKLPPASIVYGIAAALLFVFAFLHFSSGNWFTGIFVLLLAGCFMGFAWHYTKFVK